MLDTRLQHQPSLAVRHAFLAAHTVKALKDWPNASDKDRAVFRRAAEFLDTALKGDQVVKKRRVTTTAADEAAAFGWAVSAYSLHASRLNKTEREDLSRIFSDLRDALMGLSKKPTPKKAAKLAPTLTGFFQSLRDIAGKNAPESTDRLLMRTSGQP